MTFGKARVIMTSRQVMPIQRGQRFDDTLSQHRFKASQLEDIVFPITAAMLLAIRFFLARHADSRAGVIVFEVANGGEDQGGSG